MEVKNIIKAGEHFIDPRTEGPFLNISEFFFDTIQGEGRYLGTPAAFLRLQGCPVNCRWCDTAAVWKVGSKVSVKTLVDLIENSGLAKRLERESYHLVVTGGSPLLQQETLISLFEEMTLRWQRVPFIEVENECSIIPSQEFSKYIKCWNNSPKLSNSEVPEERRVNLEACRCVARDAYDFGSECYWKFVVKDSVDVEEILDTYNRVFISNNNVYLMPLGASQKEYFENREKVVELAIRYGFRYSPREHIAIWNKKTGI